MTTQNKRNFFNCRNGLLRWLVTLQMNGTCPKRATHLNNFNLFFQMSYLVSTYLIHAMRYAMLKIEEFSTFDCLTHSS